MFGSNQYFYYDLVQDMFNRFELTLEDWCNLAYGGL